MVGDETTTAGAGHGALAPDESEPRPARDWVHALETVAGDHELLGDVVATLLTKYPAVMSRLEQVVRNGDAAAVEHAAHTIKGDLRIFGATRGFELAQRLETLGWTAALTGIGDPLADL